MLNELLMIQRGMDAAGMEIPVCHPAIKDVGDMPTLRVFLSEDGSVQKVELVPDRSVLWTLRDGNHNSFPFVKGFPPLLTPPKARISKKDREQILKHAEETEFQPGRFNDWPDKGLINKIKERRKQLVALTTSDARCITDAIDRSLHACENGGGCTFMSNVCDLLIKNIKETASDDWTILAHSLLIGKFNGKQSRWETTGALFFDAEGDYQLSTSDPRTIDQLSAALADAEPQGTTHCCFLTGECTNVIEGNFPQPKLPVLGQTYLFSRNKSTPCATRYARTSAATIRVGSGIASQLVGALRQITNDANKGKTWGRLSKTDILLAYVAASVDVPVVDLLAADTFDEAMYEEGVDSDCSQIAAFEAMTGRLLLSFSGKHSSVDKTSVRYTILRKVDTGNSKAIFGGKIALNDLANAAKRWAVGERNLPAWLVSQARPPHIAPLGLVSFTQYTTVQGKNKPPGIPASEALALFIDASTDFRARRRAHQILRLVLRQRTAVCCKHTQGLTPAEVSRTCTVLGLLLHKLGRDKETYMNDAAFQLGQLLAVADQVHAGYCADVRDGKLPPSLLGNQIFAMAQISPVKALAMLCRRWKPYSGWAQKVARNRHKADELINSRKKTDQDRGWDIRKAIAQARRVDTLVRELQPAIAHMRPDDQFCAEMLLGYLAGLPSSTSGETNNSNNEDDNDA